VYVHVHHIDFLRVELMGDVCGLYMIKLDCPRENRVQDRRIDI